MKNVDGNPTISVVIPVHNQQHHICAAIDGALRQTLAPVEIIVVDDGSDDDTVERVRALGHPKVTLVTNAANLGAAASRNIGIDQARGAWVAFLDADDRWREDKLFRQWSAIKTKSATICFTNLEFFGGSENRLYWNVRPPCLAEKMSDYMIVHGQAVQTSTLFMRSAVAQSVRFDDRLHRHQDWDFVLRAERSGVAFHYLDAPLTLYNLSNPHSLSRNPDPGPSLVWMELAGALLDRRAKAAIDVQAVIPRLAKQSRLNALLALVRRVGQGGVVPRQIVRAGICIARG